MFGYPVVQWLRWAFLGLVAAAVAGFAAASSGEATAVVALVLAWLVGACLVRPLRDVLAERIAYRGWPRAEAHLAHLIRIHAQDISEAAALTHSFTEHKRVWVTDPQTKRREQQTKSITRTHHTRFSKVSRTPEGLVFDLYPPVRYGITAQTCVAAAPQIDGIIDALAQADVTVTVEAVSGSVARATVVLRDTLDPTVSLDESSADAWFGGAA